MVYACVSAGVDSVAGCHWLVKQFHICKRVSFQILHFNHGLRPQNDVMERKVVELAEYLNIPLTRIRLNPLSTSECDLRDARIAEYVTLAKPFHSEPVFINFHHLNDAVENYVNNCMSGVPEYTPIRYQTDYALESSFKVVHPFLRIPKRELVEYGLKEELERFIEHDETNMQEDYCKRNHIRHNIVPMMNKWTNLETIVKKKFYEDCR